MDILPKSFAGRDDSPRSGGIYKFLKLTKFRGIDHGRSKFREEASKIEKISLPEDITMKKLFKVKNGKEMPDFSNLATSSTSVITAKGEVPPLMTEYGELVYQRNNKSNF